MTKVGEEITLNSINIKAFFRLPVIKGGGNSVFVNEGRNSILKVQDRKLVHSWTLTHPNSFTCPAAFCCEDQAIYCALNSNVLLKWSCTDDTLKNATKFKLKESIFAVLSANETKPVILFASGKVLQTGTLLSSTQPFGNGFISENEDMIWADACNQQSGISVVCLSFSRKNETYKLHSFTVHENHIAGYFSQTLVHGSDVLKCWCLNKSSFSFFTMWSNGLILNHCLDAPQESMLLSVPDIQNLHLLAIESISSNHIALIKCNPKQKETFLEIWDIKFAALKARKSLKAVFSSSIQISAVDSVLFLSHIEELIEISIQVEKSTLAAAVGRSTTTTSKTSEFSWNKGKLTKVKKSEQNVSEKMDTSEAEQNTLNPTELIAQRIMEGGSDSLKCIPESELVRLLSLAIRYKFNQKNKSVEVDPDVILNAIFSASFNDVSLVKFMKKLNLEQAMLSLETLLSFLSNEASTNVNKTKPTDLQLFNWICLVIQSHMEALLLSKDKKCVKLLRKLDKCLAEKMSEYEDYESIQHVFHVIQKKHNILPEQYVDAKFCIEMLEI